LGKAHRYEGTYQVGCHSSTTTIAIAYLLVLLVFMWTMVIHDVTDTCLDAADPSQGKPSLVSPVGILLVITLLSHIIKASGCKRPDVRTYGRWICIITEAHGVNCIYYHYFVRCIYAPERPD
jgi:hypothetical protein